MTHVHTLSTLSSGDPSQSLSSLEAQLRGAANTAPTHCPKLPPTHVWLPRWQIPSSVSGPHGRVSPSMQGQPPLFVPSQLVSSPSTLQESCSPGPTEPSQAPQLLV